MYVLIAIAIVFAIARFIVPVEGKINKKDFFKDFAHLFVGFLFGYAVTDPTDYLKWSVPIALTIVEVIAFLVRKK